MSKRIALLAALMLIVPTLAGAQNRCLQLVNGSNAQIDVAHAPTHAPQSGITVEAWITYDDTTLPTGWRWPTLIRKSTLPGQESYFIRIDAWNNNRTILAWVVTTSTGTAAARWTFTSGQLKQWTHVAGTYDGRTAKLFVNGKQVASGGGSGPIKDNGGILRIGNGWLGQQPSEMGIETWNGLIDELRLWPFPRSDAEIRSTMNHELKNVPGEVSTWNLNGDGQDSSGTNNGTPSTYATFTASNVKLTTLSLAGSANFGSGTAGCNGTPLAGMASVPTVANGDFGFTCIRSTTTGAGLLGLSLLRLTLPVNVMGADVWVNPAAAVILPTLGGPSHAAKTAFPIPNVTALAGQKFYAQYFWTEPGCSTPLFASNGLQVTVLP